MELGFGRWAESTQKCGVCLGGEGGNGRELGTTRS